MVNSIRSMDFPIVNRRLSAGLYHNRPFAMVYESPKISSSGQMLSTLADKVSFEAYRKVSDDPTARREFWKDYKKALYICEQVIYNHDEWRNQIIDINGIRGTLERVLADAGVKEKTMYNLAGVLAYVPEMDPVLRPVYIVPNFSKRKVRGTRGRKTRTVTTGMHDNFVQMSVGSGVLYSGLKGSKFEQDQIKIYTESSPRGEEVSAIVDPRYSVIGNPSSGLPVHLALIMNANTAQKIFGRQIPSNTRIMDNYRYLE